jgi:isocitrate dehydrogenase
VDLFLHWDKDGRAPAALGARLERIAGPEFTLELVTNRGVKVYPGGNPHTLCSDHWRCRFRSAGEASPLAITRLMARAAESGLDVVKTENLYRIDGKAGYSQAQGA